MLLGSSMRATAEQPLVGRDASGDLAQANAVYESPNLHGGTPQVRKHASQRRRHSALDSEKRTVGLGNDTVPRSTQIGLDSEQRDSIRLTNADDVSVSVALRHMDSRDKHGEHQNQMRKLEIQASKDLLHQDERKDRVRDLYVNVDMALAVKKVGSP